MLSLSKHESIADVLGHSRFSALPSATRTAAFRAGAPARPRRAAAAAARRSSRDRRRWRAGRSSSRPPPLPLGADAAHVRHAVGQPMHRAAARLRERRQDAIGRAHVGDFLRIERPRRRDRRQRAVGQPIEPELVGLRASRATCRARPWSASASTVLPDGIGQRHRLGACRPWCGARSRSAPSAMVADSRSSSSSGSFISQCARRRSNSACGPPPSKPRAHSQAWSDSSSATRPLLHVVEHEQRLVVRPAHHRLAGDLVRADQAEPAAPARRRRRACWRRADRASPDGRGPARVTIGLKPCVDDLAGRLRRQHGGQRRAVDAHRLRRIPARTTPAARRHSRHSRRGSRNRASGRMPRSL